MGGLSRRRARLANRIIILAISVAVLAACSGGGSQSPVIAPASAAPSAVSAAPEASSIPSDLSTIAPPTSTVAPASDSPSPGGPTALKSGTASIHVTVGSKKESLDLQLDTRPGMAGRIDEDGSVFAQWLGEESASGTPYFSLHIPKGASGTYRTDVAAGNMYVTFYADIVQSDIENLSCKVAIEPTSSGGIAGTVDCRARLRVFLDPVTAKGTFSAEP